MANLDRRSCVPVDVDISSLANSVAAVLSLSIHRGVPVTVIEHHSVRPRQVDTHATAARRQDEAEDASVRIKALH